MKKILMATAVATIVGTTAMAGGLTTVWDDPVVTPPAVIPTWTGVYGGLSYGHTSAKRTWTEEVPVFAEQFAETPVYEEQFEEEYDEGVCKSPGVGASHSAYKCRFNGTGAFAPEVWAESREIQALNNVNSPWNDPNYRRSAIGGPSEDARRPVRYSTNSYDGIWMNAFDYAFTYNYRMVSTGMVQTGTEQVSQGIQQVGTETIEHSVSSSSNNFGGFLGYRHDFGRFVPGIEATIAEDMKTLEASAGFDLDRALAYAFVGGGHYDDKIGSGSGTVYGVGTDIKLGDRWLVGVKYTAGDFDDIDTNTTTFRVGIQF